MDLFSLNRLSPREVEVRNSSWNGAFDKYGRLAKVVDEAGEVIKSYIFASEQIVSATQIDPFDPSLAVSSSSPLMRYVDYMYGEYENLHYDSMGRLDYVEVRNLDSSRRLRYKTISYENSLKSACDLVFEDNFHMQDLI